MARPRKPHQTQRSCTVSVAVTGEERAALESLAAGVGVSLSTYARELLLHGSAARIEDGRDRAALIREVNRIGVNLNQLLHLSHTDARPHPELAAVYAKLSRLLDLLLAESLGAAA